MKLDTGLRQSSPPSSLSSPPTQPPKVWPEPTSLPANDPRLTKPHIIQPQHLGPPLTNVVAPEHNGEYGTLPPESLLPPPYSEGALPSPYVQAGQQPHVPRPAALQQEANAASSMPPSRVVKRQFSNLGIFGSTASGGGFANPFSENFLKPSSFFDWIEPEFYPHGYSEPYDPPVEGTSDDGPAKIIVPSVLGGVMLLLLIVCLILSYPRKRRQRRLGDAVQNGAKQVRDKWFRTPKKFRSGPTLTARRSGSPSELEKAWREPYAGRPQRIGSAWWTGAAKDDSKTDSKSKYIRHWPSSIPGSSLYGASSYGISRYGSSECGSSSSGLPAVALPLAGAGAASAAADFALTGDYTSMGDCTSDWSGDTCCCD